MFGKNCPPYASAGSVPAVPTSISARPACYVVLAPSQHVEIDIMVCFAAGQGKKKKKKKNTFKASCLLNKKELTIFFPRLFLLASVGGDNAD